MCGYEIRLYIFLFFALYCFFVCYNNNLRSCWLFSIRCTSKRNTKRIISLITQTHTLGSSGERRVWLFWPEQMLVVEAPLNKLTAFMSEFERSHTNFGISWGVITPPVLLGYAAKLYFYPELLCMKKVKNAPIYVKLKSSKMWPFALIIAPSNFF